VDCASSEASASIAKWWAEAFDANLVHDEREFSSVTHITGAPFDSLDLIPVPEPKTVKNRIHIDVTAHDLNLALAHGALVLRPSDNEVSWTVCADPDGNEFCVFASG
jgi:hypothetical protein